MSKIRYKLFAACAACALLLSGCGGSSLNPFRIDVPQINIPPLLQPTNPNRTTNQGTLSETRLHDMAGQNPVISNNTLTHNSPLGDVIDLTVTGNNIAGSRYTLAKSGSGVPANYWTIRDPQSGNVRSEVSNATGMRGGANVTYDVYAVSRNEGSRRVGYTIFEDRSSSSDTDYLAGGFWTEVVLSGSNVVQSYTGSGVFVSGEPHSGTLPSGLGTATYSGEAAGTYRRDNNVIGAFGGNVSFRVNFNGNNTSMNGSLTGVEGNDTGSSVNRLSGVQINFGTATNASGLYAGNVSCSGSCSGASGKWGGRFYGGAPSSANGTPDLFGGTFAVQNLNPSSGVADDVDMMGFFFTGKE